MCVESNRVGSWWKVHVFPMRRLDVALFSDTVPSVTSSVNAVFLFTGCIGNSHCERALGSLCTCKAGRCGWGIMHASCMGTPCLGLGQAASRAALGLGWTQPSSQTSKGAAEMLCSDKMVCIPHL